MDAIPPPLPSSLLQDASMNSQGENSSRSSSVLKSRKTPDRDDDGTFSDGSYSDASIDASQIDARLEDASKLREEGNDKLKNGHLEEAWTKYSSAIKKLRFSSSEDEKTNQTEKKKAMLLALHLNCTLVRLKQSKWAAAIACSNKALNIDNKNVKALFRRAIARSKLGLLEEARLDLTHCTSAEPQNCEARRELQRVRNEIKEAAEKTKKAYSGLFDRASGLYADQELRMAEERKRKKEEDEREKKEFEVANDKRLAEKLEPFKSIEDWREHKKSRVEKSNARKPVKSSAVTSGPDSDLDEDDKKIIGETKKMGYCYFGNKNITPEEKQRLQAQNLPVKLDGAQETVESPTNDKALSEWNSRGTTYEEKDVSEQVKTVLKEKLGGMAFGMTCGNENYDFTVATPTTITGDAEVMVLRASKRYLYDFNVNLNFKLKSLISGNSSSGTVSIPDLSSTASRQTVDAKERLYEFEWMKSSVMKVKFSQISSDFSGQTPESKWLEGHVTTERPLSGH